MSRSRNSRFDKGQSVDCAGWVASAEGEAGPSSFDVVSRMRLHLRLLLVFHVSDVPEQRLELNGQLATRLEDVNRCETSRNLSLLLGLRYSWMIIDSRGLWL